jgi:pyruvyl transferase EpsI
MALANNIRNRISDKIAFEKEKYAFLKPCLGRGKKVYLMETPIHNNIGDSLIAVAEIEYLNKQCKLPVVEVNQSSLEKYGNVLKYFIHPNDVIVLHGGGNFGNLWIHHENIRRKIIKDFPNNNMILMPQSYSFSEDNEGKAELQKSVEIYASAKKLELFIRDSISFQLAATNFKNHVTLVPDIAFTLPKKDFHCQRKGVLMCFRGDAEKKLDHKIIQQLETQFLKNNIEVKLTDMIHQGQIFPEQRKNIIADKAKEFASAKLVLTDRMHGMILAYLTNTPCIVFECNNHKIRGTYEWIKNCGYISLCDTVDLEKIIFYYNNNWAVQNCLTIDDFSQIKLTIEKT